MACSGRAYDMQQKMSYMSKKVRPRAFASSFCLSVIHTGSSSNENRTRRRASRSRSNPSRQDRCETRSTHWGLKNIPGSLKWFSNCVFTVVKVDRVACKTGSRVPGTSLDRYIGTRRVARSRLNMMIQPGFNRTSIERAIQVTQLDVPSTDSRRYISPVP